MLAVLCTYSEHQLEGQAYMAGIHGVFKRLRHNGRLKFQKAANSSAQTVTQGGSPPKEASCATHSQADMVYSCWPTACCAAAPALHRPHSLLGLAHPMLLHPAAVRSALLPQPSLQAHSCHQCQRHRSSC
jgi:hypothetical protein